MKQHPYLKDTSCIYRLVDEYKKYGSIVVAYDFDNTVYDYHSKGHDYVEVVRLLRAAEKAGCYLIVFTAEEDVAKIKKILSKQNIPYDSINENPPFFKGKSGKIYYNILLDDRAGLKSAYKQLKTAIKIIKDKI